MKPYFGMPDGWPVRIGDLPSGAVSVSLSFNNEEYARATVQYRGQVVLCLAGIGEDGQWYALLTHGQNAVAARSVPWWRRWLVW